LGLSCDSLLKSQDRFADFAPTIFHNCWLPLSVRFAKFLDQAAGEPILGQSSLESVLALEFFALLRREISFEENFTWIVLLRDGEHPCAEEKYSGEQSRPASHDTTLRRHDRPTEGSFLYHRRRELLETPRKSSPLFAKRDSNFTLVPCQRWWP
jgi:hypothetical protein